MLPALYLDECVFLDTAQYLIARGIAIVTAQSVGMVSVSDEAQLRFAAARGWTLLSINARHFIRLHTTFQASNEQHAGIIAIPEGSYALRLAIRAAMTLDWIAAEFPDPRNLLFRWTDLQQRLISGYLLEGYTEAEVALALGRTMTLP
ncbi:MAG: DUF5615 family PIN-like protein [Thermomicrobiales bacterium]